MQRDRWWEIFFSDPHRCVLCEEPTDYPYILCPECEGKLEKADLCRDIEGISCHIPYFYNRFLKKHYTAFKFEGKAYLYHTFGHLLAQYIAEKQELKTSWITYIPMDERRRYFRGYNPVEKMARQIAEERDLFLVPTLIKRDTRREQNKSNREERIANVKGAFALNVSCDCIIGEHVQSGKKGKIPLDVLQKHRGILLDDFVTTGATMREAVIELEKGSLNMVGLALGSSAME